MSYFRLYPRRNNTIFRYLDLGPYSQNSFPANILPNTIPANIKWTLTTNTGANPIMELQDGKGESLLMFSFDLPDWLREKLGFYTYKCNLKLYDAGTLFEPAIKLKEVQLNYFTNDFVEGDGYAFLKPKAKQGVSNFLYRDSINPWTDTTFTPVVNYHLNIINEDLSFDVTTTVQQSVQNSTLANYSLKIVNRDTDLDNIYTKFIHSNYTRTVFKPYLEFIIDDAIEDKSYDLVANQSNKIYLLNQRNINFSGPVVATVTDNNGTAIPFTLFNPLTGVYYIEFTPPIPSSIRNEYVTILWEIDGVPLHKQVLEVKNPNQIYTEFDNKKLVFYPVTPYAHNIVRQNDIIPFEVISEIRGVGGNIVNFNYEYKVLSMDGFEMIPWTPVSVYKEKMFFMVDTSFFFPEQSYEVFLRIKEDQWSISSDKSHKFKLAQDAQSHLRNLNASPYWSREYFFSK